MALNSKTIILLLLGIIICGVIYFLIFQRRKSKVQAQQDLQFHLTQIFADLTHWDSAIKNILEVICKYMGWDFASYWELEKRKGVIYSKACFKTDKPGINAFEEVTLNTRFHRGIGLPGRVWENNEPAWVPNVLKDSNFPRLPMAREANLHSGFCFPVVSEKDVIGVIEVFTSQIHKPKPELVKIIAVLGSRIGQFHQRIHSEEERKRLISQLQVANELLHQTARTDTLTNLPNRRSLVESIEKEHARHLRTKRPLSFIMGDIDLFKQINDSLGHDVGDFALSHTALILKEHCRQHDIIGRWGGEEFLIILPDTDLDEAINLAERLRSSVALAPYQLLNKSFSVTISLGVATLQENQLPSQCISQADQNMYVAKGKGRNQVVPSSYEKETMNEM